MTLTNVVKYNYRTEIVIMRTARIPLNELERRKVVKVARGERMTVPKLLKSFALGQIEADTQPSKPVSEVEK